MPAQVTHHKVIGPSRWGGTEASLRLIDEARARGVDVSSDQYPYTASSTGLTILFPAWSKEGGQVENELKARRVRLQPSFDAVGSKNPLLEGRAVSCP